MAPDSQQYNKKLFSNFLWRFFERFGAKGVEFLVSIILARLLAPEDYGIIALVTVFITILNVFVDSGLGNALIQKKEADDADFSSVFFFNICVCGILYIAMWFAAKYIAAFFEEPRLTPIIRALSLTLIISGVKNIQQAYVSRNLLFKKFFFSTLGGTIIAAIVGIFLAYRGYGVWALVSQQLVNAFIDTVILWATVKWRPTLNFSISRLKILLSFGWKLLLSGLIDTIYNDIRQLVIGKFYSNSDLAYYNQGMKYPNLLAANINASIDSILLPVMSQEQENMARIKSMTRRSIKVSLYFMAPMMFGICAVAEPLIELLLTEKWLPCVPYLRIFCILYTFYPINTANLNAIKAMGRSDIFLKLEIIKKLLGIAVLFATVWFSPFVIACSLLFTTWICQLINAWPNKKLLNYSYKEQLLDIFPTLAIAVIMFLAVWSIGEFIKISVPVKLLIQTGIGISVYTAGSLLLKIDSLSYIINQLKGFAAKK